MFWRFGKMSKSENQQSQLSFEEAYKRLEDIAKKLEDGDTPLEDSFGLYSEGQKLIDSCQGILDQAEKKLKILKIQPDGFHTEETDLE